jgi:hypothetical protein
MPEVIEPERGGITVVDVLITHIHLLPESVVASEDQRAFRQG